MGRLINPYSVSFYPRWEENAILAGDALTDIKIFLNVTDLLHPAILQYPNGTALGTDTPPDSDRFS